MKRARRRFASIPIRMLISVENCARIPPAQAAAAPLPIRPPAIPVTWRPAGGRDQRDANLANELHLVPVVVPASEQYHLPGIDLTQLEASPQGAAVGPAAVAGRIIQVRMRVYVKDAQPSVEPALLRNQCGADG